MKSEITKDEAASPILVTDTDADIDTNKTILIFQHPELYFFPKYKNMVFSPFGVKEHGLLYWIYKAMYLAHIPGYSFFWGNWKKHLKTAKKVIIFDYGYQRGMETYIHTINPDCKVYLFYWNIITPARINYKLFTDKEAIYSTDQADCEKYNFKYNNMFYCEKYYEPYRPCKKNKLFFLGVDKGRADLLLCLKSVFEKSGIECDIHLLVCGFNKKRRHELKSILTDKRLSYEEYLTQLRQSSLILDITQAGQIAPTMRVMEAIYLSKKLIPNNRSLSSNDFYTENNIFILPDEYDDSLTDQLKEFLKRPFSPYSPEIRQKYGCNEWLTHFQSNTGNTQQ